MSLKIAILDDEKHACETLQWQLEQIEIEYDIIGVFQNPKEAVQALKMNKPDLIFLDIEMPGLNGFQFLEQLNMPDVNIVFTTAYDQFALNAFRVNAVDYLMKPVDITELEASIQRAINNNDHYQPELLEKLFNQLNRSKSCKEKIGFASVHGIDFVNCQDIIYCHSESNYTRIYLESGRKILATKTLKDIESQLPESIFFRVHNSYIANLSKVISYVHNNGGALILENDIEIKVSRTRKKELLERLASF